MAADVADRKPVVHNFILTCDTILTSQISVDAVDIFFSELLFIMKIKKNTKVWYKNYN